jgi:hypothetical protein
MNEQQWQACSDPELMLEYMRLKASDRKLRLLACAVCRLHWDLFVDQLTRETVELVECLADGVVPFHVPRFRAIEARTRLGSSPAVLAAEACAGDEAYLAAYNTCKELALAHIRPFLALRSTGAERARHPIPQPRVISAGLVRHIFGNPFRPYLAPASWPLSVVRLAASLYEGQDCSFALHDALLEAGHAELAEHFQKEQRHSKGCWVVDRVLDKK